MSRAIWVDTLTEGAAACPFCGCIGMQRLRSESTGDGDCLMAIDCMACGGHGPTVKAGSLLDKRSAKKALAKWEKRS